jgi:hypothetical protein
MNIYIVIDNLEEFSSETRLNNLVNNEFYK